MKNSHCAFCNSPIKHNFADLGMSPIANDYLSQDQLNRVENFYPIRANVCDKCLLVQLEEIESPAYMFGDGNYPYFSSYSDSWLKHAKAYSDMIISKLGLNQNSQVVEIASNDGYMLQYFQEKQIPVLGIEPAGNVAKVAQEKGIPVIVKFFGVETAKEVVSQGKQADLLLGNNVLAHVPDLNDFVAGMKLVLKPSGVLTMEFPHLLQIVSGNQFDTIHEEHFSYLSLLTVEQIFTTHGLTLFDVEEIPTHGGSIRIYGKHDNLPTPIVSDRIAEVKQKEIAAGLHQIETYLKFKERVKETKRKLLTFLIEAQEAGKVIVAYGAPSKGNILLNYCGIGTDFIDYVVDRNPHKQGLFMPGSHIPILSPDKIWETQPDYLLILAWNLKDEVMEQMAKIREWGGKFVVPIPEAQVYP